MDVKLIQQIFEVCIIPLLGILTAYLISFIKVKIEELKNRLVENQNEYHQHIINKYLALIQSTIEQCVIATNQTFVDSLKEKNEFNQKAWKEAFDKTYNAVLAILTDEGKKYVVEAVGDLDTYLKVMIENAVQAQKNK